MRKLLDILLLRKVFETEPVVLRVAEPYVHLTDEEADRPA
jgi:hypothetical protein